MLEKKQALIYYHTFYAFCHIYMNVILLNLHGRGNSEVNIFHRRCHGWIQIAYYKPCGGAFFLNSFPSLNLGCPHPNGTKTLVLNNVKSVVLKYYTTFPHTCQGGFFLQIHNSLLSNLSSHYFTFLSDPGNGYNNQFYDSFNTEKSLLKPISEEQVR